MNLDLNHSEKIARLLQSHLSQKKTPRQVSIPSKGGRLFIQLEEIIRCEAYGRCTWFYLTENRRVLSSENLGEYEETLASEDRQTSTPFFRIHHSHLINLRHIHKFNCREHSVEMSDQSCLGIAHRRRPLFTQLLKQLNLF